MNIFQAALDFVKDPNKRYLRVTREQHQTLLQEMPESMLAALPLNVHVNGGMVLSTATFARPTVRVVEGRPVYDVAVAGDGSVDGVRLVLVDSPGDLP